MSNLKKEFKKRDVERMRNLITGKQGKKTTLGIGYKKEKKHTMKKVMFGKKIIVLGPLKMVSNKI